MASDSSSMQWACQDLNLEPAVYKTAALPLSYMPMVGQTVWI